jgi:magnesium transporter
MSVGVPVGGVAGREGATGTLIGLVLAILVYPAALAWVGQGVALTVAATIWAACTVATSVGMGLPWLLRALGQDPAFGSGPLATVIQDLLTLLIYFGFAVVFL